jgi:hypothetical protein
MSNNQNSYDAQYNEWNQMIVPDTGGITASYSEQRAAGINPGKSVYLAHVKLGVHRANEIPKSYVNANATATASVAKPLQYLGTPARIGLRGEYCHIVFINCGSF